MLTSETGTRLYCVSLNFYQPHRQSSPDIEDPSDRDVIKTSTPIPHHRNLTAVMSNASVIGEDLEMHWDMDMIDAGMSSPKMQFEPVSLCAISVHPLFSILKVMKS